MGAFQLVPRGSLVHQMPADTASPMTIGTDVRGKNLSALDVSGMKFLAVSHITVCG